MSLLYQNPSSLKFWRKRMKLQRLVVVLVIGLMTVECNYQVPSYAGHFSKNFFQVANITSGKFTYFEYHFGIDFDYQNQTVYLANTQKHCIQSYNLKTQRKIILAGNFNQPGTKIGDFNYMLFNSPKGLAFYQQDTRAQLSEINMKTYIVANPSCNLQDPQCILSNPINNLTMNNIRLDPPINLFPETSSTRYLLVTDSNNNCIKKLNLEKQTSQIIAGVCGESGFSDGPLGFNRLNYPTSIGINKHGNVYFYDEGNERMRKILPNGTVQTMLNGACKLYSITRKIGGYSLKSIICYDDWIQFDKDSNENFGLADQFLNICVEHSSRCS